MSVVSTRAVTFLAAVGTPALVLNDKPHCVVAPPPPQPTNTTAKAARNAARRAIFIVAESSFAGVVHGCAGSSCSAFAAS
jgi:hypothetical protein